MNIMTLQTFSEEKVPRCKIFPVNDINKKS